MPDSPGKSHIPPAPDSAPVEDHLDMDLEIDKPAGDTLDTVHAYNLAAEIESRLRRLQDAIQPDDSEPIRQAVDTLKQDHERLKQKLDQVREELNGREKKNRRLHKQIKYLVERYNERNHRVQGLKKELAQVRDHAASDHTASPDHTELQQQLQREQQTNTQLREQLDALQEEMATARRRLTAADDSNERLRSLEDELSTMQQSLNDQRETTATTQQELEQFRQKLEQTDGQLEQSQRELTQTQQELEQSRQDLAARDEAISQLQQEHQDRHDADQARLHTLQERIEQALTEQEQTAAERDQARTERDQACAEREDARREHQEIQTQLTALQQDQTSARQLLEELEQQKTDLEEQLDTARVQNESITQDLEASRQQQESLQQRLTETEQQKQDIQQQLEESRQQTEAAQQHLESTQQQLETNQQQLESARQQYESTHRQLESTQSDLDQARQQKEAIEQQQAATQAELGELRSQHASAHRELTESREHNSRLEQQLVDLQAVTDNEKRQAEQQIIDLQQRRNALQQEMDQRITELARKAEDIEDQQREIERLNERIDDAQQQARQYEEQLRETNERLSQAQAQSSDRLRQIEQLQSDLENQQSAASAEITRLRETITTLESSGSELSLKLKRLEHTNADKSERVAQLEDDLKREQEQHEQSRSSAQQQQSDLQDRLTAQQEQHRQLHTAFQDRGRQLKQLSDTLDRQQAEARQRERAVHDQLEQQQADIAALQAQLSDTQQESESRDTRNQELRAQNSELQDALNQTIVKLEGISAGGISPESEWNLPGTQDRQQRPGFARAGMAAAILMGVLSVALTTWLFTRETEKPTYRVTGVIAAPGGHDALLTRMADVARQKHGIEARLDPEALFLELAVTTADPQDAVDQVNRAGRELTSLAGHWNQPPAASQPADHQSSREHQPKSSLLTLEQLDTLANQPVDIVSSASTQLQVRWQKLREERELITRSMTDLTPKLQNTASRPADLEADEAEITEALNTHPQLQADLAAFSQWKHQLQNRLHESIVAGMNWFELFDQEITAAQAELEAIIAEDHPADVTEQLQVIRETLSLWSQAITTLEQQWKTQQKKVQENSSNLLTIQNQLETAANAFLEQQSASRTRLDQAIHTIGQGEGHLTRRLVLRNNLSKAFTDLLAAQKQAVSAARSVTLNQDVELAAIIGRMDGLSKRILQLRDQITERVRQSQFEQIRRRREQEAATARAEYERLAARAAELDRDIARTAEQAMEMLTQGRSQWSQLIQQVDLARQQAENAEDPTPQASGQSPPEMPLVQFIPARTLHLEQVATGSQHLSENLLIGLSPLAAFAVIGGLVWWLGRRTNGGDSDYAQSLLRRAGNPLNDTSTLQEETQEHSSG